MTKNPELVLIHGMWNTPQVWNTYRERYEAAGYKVHTPALRHHDVTPQDPPHPDLGTTSLLDYTADLVTFVESLNEQPVLIGHSLGGLLAQLVAARTPVRALVALTPAPPAGVMAVRPSVFKIFRRILFTWGHWRKPTFPTYEELRYGVFNNVDEETAKTYYKQEVWDSGRATAEMAHWMFDPGKASRVDTDKINCPVIIFGAELDRITPEVNCAAAARQYDGKAEYEILKGHAHFIQAEPGWEKIADRVLDWVEKNA